MKQAAPTYSLVIPIRNEQETLLELGCRVAAVLDELDGPGEVILVDDGSTDGSHAVMIELCDRDPRFKVLGLSRSFGHQLAITAGLDFAAGQAVVVLDGDLQDPPEVILQMARRWREGFQVVYGVRETREGEPPLRLLRAKIFYRLLRRLTDVDMPVDAGDFRLIDRSVVDALASMRESNRYLRGMVSWTGFNQTGVRYHRAPRFAGETKYPLRKLLQLGADGLLGFSNAPLRAALKLGFVISGGAFLLAVGAVAAKLAGLYSVPGIASLVVVTLFLGGVQLVVLGVLGEYVARVYEEAKHRPLYLVRDLRGFGEEPALEKRLVVGRKAEWGGAHALERDSPSAAVRSR